VFNLRPKELYSLEPVELYEMVEAYTIARNEEFKVDMQKLAWQTSIIINCMGTLKKKIKPTDLFNPDEGEDNQKGIKSVDKDEHKKLQEELLDSFK
jgi:hypothetical protein